MPDEPTTPAAGDEPNVEEFKPITSQEDLNRLIGDRVARERAKFADYREVKAKAAKLDELEAQNKTESEKTNDRIAQLERELESTRTTALRSRIQAKYGIDDEDADLFLTGSDEDALTKQAERLASRAADRKKQGPHVPKQGTDTTSPKPDEMRDSVRSLFGKTG